MPDSAPVNVSKLASKVAGALRSVHKPLLVTSFRADPVVPLMKDVLKLLLELRRIVNSTRISVAGEEIVGGSMKSLERFYGGANLLVTISDDIGNGPSAKDLGVLRIQWTECRETLLVMLLPLSRILDSLSEMTSAWYSTEPATRRRAGKERTTAESTSRIRDDRSEDRAG